MSFPEEQIVRRRRLAFNSQVRVNVGDKVRPDTVVALTILPLPRLFFLSAFRSLPRGVLEGYDADWLVKAGEYVDTDTPMVQFTRTERELGEVIAPGGVRAEGPSQRMFRSPVSGTVESIVEGSGLVLLREVIDYGRRRADIHAGFKVGVWGRKLKRYLKHKKGEFVEKGQILAQRIKTGDSSSPGSIAIARAPIAGVITDIDLEKGLVQLHREFKEVELAAGFFGEVTAIDQEGIEISARGRRAQGVCGVGGESYGRLRVAAPEAGAELEAGHISSDDSGRVLVAGSHVGLEALQKAAEAGVGGIITGGADHLDLCEFLGEDFAVAITGREKMPFPVIITGEFGRSPMQPELFDFFKSHEGSWAHIDSTTHMRAGVVRPEIIIMSE